jgi:hypothetical protein
MHVHCQDTCCMTKAVLHVHVHVACLCQCCMPMLMSMYIYIEMLDHLASSQSGTGLKKLTILDQVRYRTNLTQSGIFIVRYQTKIRDAGMPMPALVFSMSMPRYAHYEDKTMFRIRRIFFTILGSVS